MPPGGRQKVIMNIIHHAFYRVCRAAITPYYYLKGFRRERYDPKSKTYLVLANHNTNWDFFLYGLVLKKHMYFVASEHIYRLGFLSRVIRFLAGPIPRKKGSAADDTVDMILDYLRRGENVCMMPEGNRSFSGVTCFISPRTAELAKSSGAGLVTVSIHGGYFVNPRWSREKRHGPTRGHVEHEYTPEQLSKMSVEEIYDAICRDLYVDAYAEQEQRRDRYTCARPAESLESALFWCPSCGSMHDMASSGDRFFCRKCGLTVRYNEYGFLEGVSPAEPPYTTVRDWYRAELAYLKEKLPAVTDPDEPVFFDDGHRLALVDPGKGTVPVTSGRISLYKDRLVFAGSDAPVVFPLSGISKISVALTDTMLFTADGAYYEVKAEHEAYSALKYVIAIRLLHGKDYC